ncbi:hypothetical protein BXZ70DRAFT_1006518 [Cristinia sonorae]|uniref:DUF7053 domain-containing protein n=1 Tax=Cristinia sonorae TaxID=1940300 RepID=A0A8K0URT3_9AGAR|nr:hypothetical protein BXZ70DRAFT_1006518 [Cristinia sonorae]
MFSWFFDLFRQSRTIIFSRSAQCTLSTARAVLTDAQSLIDLNPRVIHRVQSKSDPSLWTIVYSMEVLWHTFRFSYTARVTAVNENGMEFVVNAPLGTSLRTKWEVEEESEREGTVTIVEVVTANASPLFMPLTLRDLVPIHKALQDQLVAILEGRADNKVLAEIATS